MLELEHRVKNTLAVVTTVIERTREDTKSIDDFASSLRNRIQSIARAFPPNLDHGLRFGSSSHILLARTP